MEEICVTYKREVVRWSATTAVLECKFQSGGTVRVICDCEKGDLEPDIPYRFSWEYKYHKTYGHLFICFSHCALAFAWTLPFVRNPLPLEQVSPF